MRKYKINFRISEFNISSKPIPQTVCDKILHFHILPMQPVRDEMKIPIYPSQKSGYRSIAWEKRHGRKGKSQHTFKGKGAVDWTCKDFTKNQKTLLRKIIDHTEYTRMAIYETFIHCDYKETPTGRRQIFKSTPNSKWTFISHADEYKENSL